MRKCVLFICAGLLLGGINSCSELLGGKGITEGMIEYDITYPKIDPNSSMLFGMPTKAYLRFKDNNTSNDMSGMMGMFSLTYISDYKKQLVEQKLTLLSNKYAANISSTDLNRLNDSYVASIETKKGIAEIAGYKCKEALVKLVNGDELTIYYTNEIGIKNPNWSNPYSKISGVLLDFQLERYGITMRLKATAVLDQKVDDAFFAFAKDSSEYKKIVFTEMEKILQAFSPVSD